MTATHNDPEIPAPFIDWIVFDRSWGAWSEPCTTLEEAQELAGRTGGGPVYRRTWLLEPDC